MTPLLVPLLFAALVSVMLLAMVLPPRVTLTVEGDALHVRLGFWDAVYCVRRSFRVPLVQIEGVAAAARELIAQTGMRLPGASWPGVIRAGSYGTGAVRDFWDVRRGRLLLVVELRPGAAYRRLVFEVPDAHAEALRLRPALGSYSGTFRD